MYIFQYQVLAAETKIYPEDLAREYCIIGLASEVGEVAALIKRSIRDGISIDRDKMRAELGDVLWYLSMLATESGLSLTEVAIENLRKLGKRKVDGTLKGSGDVR